MDQEISRLLQQTRADPSVENLSRLSYLAKRVGLAVTFVANWNGTHESYYRLVPTRNKAGIPLIERGGAYLKKWDRLSKRTLQRWYDGHAQKPRRESNGIVYGGVPTILKVVLVDPSWTPQQVKDYELAHRNDWGNISFTEIADQIEDEFRQNPTTWRKKKSNPDDSYRQRERLSRQDDSPEAQAKLLVERIRTGELWPEKVKIAAQLGDKASQMVTGETSRGYGRTIESAVMILSRRQAGQIFEYVLNEASRYAEQHEIDGEAFNTINWFINDEIEEDIIYKDSVAMIVLSYWEILAGLWRQTPLEAKHMADRLNQRLIDYLLSY